MKSYANFSMRMPIEAKLRLEQIARENHLNMSQMVVQMIFHWPVERPEEIGQLSMDDIKKS